MASVRDWSHGATLLCDDLLDNLDLRWNPTLFALALSAAAQHMIHAASNVYTLCKRARTRWNLTYPWEEWKAMFQEAETVENVALRNDALSAAIAMVTAERLHDHLPMERERRINTLAMLEQSNRVEILMAKRNSKI